ncbi:LAFA_0D16248g1_1 [Lachancea sp. 'fantastica']|nr:LAFA_0D16248g1_1 [Lachancea sp. 'fantastica']
MAKALRKRVSRAAPKTDRKSPAVASNRISTAALDETRVPAIQEFQDLVDLQRNEFENVKMGLSQQNVQLARCNSELMIKVREMDKSVSELIQENVCLRSKLSLKEHEFKERLASTIESLEEGVLQRFDELLHMFESVRRRQGLEVPHDSLVRRSALLNEPRSILKRDRSRHSRDTSTTTIAFNESRNQIISPEPGNSHNKPSEEAVASPSAKKRRKSSRRESLFHPSDFEFADIATNEDTTTAAQEAVSGIPTEATMDEQITSSRKSFEESITDTDLPQQPHHDSVEESCNFTNSLIEYSIPEELPEKHVETSVTSDSAKLQVYHDIEEQPQRVDSRLLPDSMANSASRAHAVSGEPQRMSFEQNTTSSQKKVKHSMKSRVSQRRIVDEVMPTTCGSTEDLSDSSRLRRTRGKEINYALPSLRAKMRRPTEKLVDATTVTNIRDLQVEGNRRKSGSYSRDGSPLIHEDQADNSKTNDPKKTPEPSQQVQETSNLSTAAQESAKATVIVPQKPKISAFSPKIPKMNPLKDITNNNAPAKSSMKTKKLFKKPIVGDLGGENSNSFDDSSGNRSTSFRVNEEDLSLFNLLDDLKTHTVPKTHRAKARQEAEKHGKKPAFRL